MVAYHEFNYKKHKIGIEKITYDYVGYNPKEVQFILFNIEGEKINILRDTLGEIKTFKEAKEYLKKFIDNAVFMGSHLGWCMPNEIN